MGARGRQFDISSERNLTRMMRMKSTNKVGMKLQAKSRVGGHVTTEPGAVA